MKLTTTLSLLLTFPSLASAEVDFLRDVAPVLLRRCSGCHGPRKAEGDYRIHTFLFLMSAGTSGFPAVVPGKPDESELLLRIRETDESMRMPQQDDTLPITDQKLIEQWIREGARFEGVSDLPLTRQLPPRDHASAPVQYRIPIPIQAVAFSHSGDLLASSGYREVIIWDAVTGQLVQRINHLPQRIQSIDWSRDDSLLLIGGGVPGEYGEVSLVNVASGKRTRVLATFEDIVMDSNFNFDHSKVAAVSAGSRTQVVDLRSGQVMWESRVHSDWATGVTFSQEDRFVVTTSRDQTVKVQDATTGDLFTTYNGHRKQLGEYIGRFAVYAIEREPESGQLITVGEGKAARIWIPEQARAENGTAADMEGRFFKKGHTRFIEHQLSKPVLALAVAEGNVFMAGANGIVRVYRFHDFTHLRDLTGNQDWIFSLSASHTSPYLATGSFDGIIRIWNYESGTELLSFHAAPGYPATAETRSK